MKKLMMVFVLMVWVIVALGVMGSASDILFEDNFDGDSLREHWEVVIGRDNTVNPLYIAEVAADYIVKDGQLMIDAPVGDTYFDLKGYELTGDFTIEIKFRFSSERCDNPGNFMTIFHRPEEDYISWWDSEGIGVSMRHWDSMMSVYDLKNGTTLDLWEVLWGSDIYDIDHVIKLKIEGSMLYVYFDDMEVISSSFDFGVPISEFPHGGFSFKVYYSIVAFDYIKIYR